MSVLHMAVIHKSEDTPDRRIAPTTLEFILSARILSPSIIKTENNDRGAEHGTLIIRAPTTLSQVSISSCVRIQGMNRRMSVGVVVRS